MKWKKVAPKFGDERHRWRFLLRPKHDKARGEVRWLCWAVCVERYTWVQGWLFVGFYPPDPGRVG